MKIFLDVHYCAPEVASVGLTEEKALEKGYTLKIGKFPFTASGKSSSLWTFRWICQSNI